MEQEIVRPDVSNFIKSLRDVGYTFDVAIADLLDNSITAGAKTISIIAKKDPVMRLTILDDGIGMSEAELVEAMRLGSKDPEAEREKADLGRFGLGLKTASFSQCKSLTVITKQQSTIAARRWDLDYLSKHNEWTLLKPSEIDISEYEGYEHLVQQTSGTLVVWEAIDGIEKDLFDEEIVHLRNHLSLVFHRFLENDIQFPNIKILLNYQLLEPFNPFNPKHAATQILEKEKIKYQGKTITVQPYILPHHSKIKQSEYDYYATEEGYTKAQGFYLYREGRLLIYGTWWGLNRVSDMHRLVRIQVDVTNDQDHLWNIDVKKSTASPQKGIRDHLRRVLNSVLSQGTKPYTGRGKRVRTSATVPVWEVLLNEEDVRFVVNRSHPLVEAIKRNVDEEQQQLLDLLLSMMEADLPLNAIQSHMISNPHSIQQEKQVSEEQLNEIVEALRKAGYEEDQIDALLDSDRIKKIKGSK